MPPTKRPRSDTVARARRLRKEATFAERTLWQRLRGARLDGLVFRRQHPAGAYILDFFCTAARLAVEIDGPVHGEPGQAAHDRRRDAWLEEQGVAVLRLPERIILEDGMRALALIRDTARRRIDQLRLISAPGKPPSVG